MTTAVPTFWVCVAHRWSVPPADCGARGTAYTAGDKHCKDTRHPILTTTRRELADKYAGPTTERGAV